jgi:superfamily I DNA/RNA helicase
VQEGYVWFGEGHSPIMQESDYRKFNKDCDYNIKTGKLTKIGTSASDAPTFFTDPYLSFYSLMKSTRTTANETCSLPILKSKITPVKLINFAEEFEQWKSDNDKIDFHDMVEIVLKNKLCPDCSVQIYDEVQDMNTQLFDVAKMWSKHAEKVVLAGDPLQTLYPWLGANPDNFINWEGKLKILRESRRLPKNIWKIASDIIQYNTPYRTPEGIETKPTDGFVGQMPIEQLQGWLSMHPKSKDSTVFHLVRTNYLGFNVANILADLGIPFKGISEYEWQSSEITLYNTLKYIQNSDNITVFGYNEIVDAFPLNLIGNKHGYTKKEIKETVMKGSFVPSVNDFTPALKAILKSKNPLANCELKGLSLRKLQGALSANTPVITPYTCELVKLLTIHGAKGLEADTNFLHNGITPLVSKSMNTERGRENEAYIWYVGVTRAKRNLIVVKYGKSYPIPRVCA